MSNEGKSKGLAGRNLAAVLIVVAICITSIALMALSQGINGTVMSLCLGGLGVVVGAAGGTFIRK